MYCAEYKGPDLLTFPFLLLSLFCHFSCPFLKASIFPSAYKGINILISSSLLPPVTPHTQSTKQQEHVWASECVCPYGTGTFVSSAPCQPLSPVQNTLMCTNLPLHSQDYCSLLL